MKELHTLFANLNELLLVDCEFDSNMRNLLGQCQNLKDIDIGANFFPPAAGILKQRFAQLEKVDWNGRFFEDELLAFFALNQQITTLHFILDHYMNSLTLLRAIVDSLPNLVDLSAVGLSSNPSDLTGCIEFIGQLKCLKSLHIDTLPTTYRGSGQLV